MKDLVKIGLVRLAKNYYYIGGCILAFAITYWAMTVRPIPQLMSHDATDVAIFISAAIILFFSIFIGLFCGNENEDGILRNKVIVGHTQHEAYFANYLTLVLAAIGMMICWLVGAFASGVPFSFRLLVYFFIAVLYNSAYIAVIYAIVFRTKRQAVGIMISIGWFYMLLTAVLMGNFFYMITEGKEVFQRIIIMAYNMSAVGQCFARTDFVDPGLANPFVQISMSLLVFAIATFCGTLGLKKRDVK